MGAASKMAGNGWFRCARPTSSAERRSCVAGPPVPMALMRRGRPLKRWRYVGFYGPDAMLCAGDVRVGPLRQRFWAVAEPGRPLCEGTSLRAGGVSIDGPRVEIDAEGVHADLTAEESGGIATLHPNGRAGYVWTRKQAGVRMRGSLAVDGRSLELDGRGAIDDTAGYHARRTSWRWSAGGGRTRD